MEWRRVSRLDEFMDALKVIASSLQKIAEAYEPVKDGIDFIEWKTSVPTGRTIASFQVDGPGWKKLQKSKQFRDFLKKLQECQTSDNQTRRTARLD